MRKAWFALLVCVCVGFSTTAYATPPSDAQIDQLFETIDMRRTLDQLAGEMEAMTLRMGDEMLGQDATAEERDALRQAAVERSAMMRKALDWDTIAPVYRRVYARIFSAEEIDAMLDFYRSGHGRSILQKMPLAMKASMEEMQPLMRTLFDEARASLEATRHPKTQADQAD